MNARRNIPVADLEAHFCDELIVFMRDAEQRLATRANPAIAEKQERLLNASLSIKVV